MVYKQQSQVHRYNRFHLQPHIHQSFCCMSSLPSSLPFLLLSLIDLEEIIFQEGISLQVNQSKSILQDLSFHSFIVYEANGQLVRI